MVPVVASEKLARSKVWGEESPEVRWAGAFASCGGNGSTAIMSPTALKTYGADASVWWVRWRLFFLSVSELFGYDGGQRWWVSHYLFEKRVRVEASMPTPVRPSSNAVPIAA